MATFGIDVSKWQGDFNFQKAKAEGVKFAILRGAYSTSKDSRFDAYYNTCKSLKLPIGVYHYSMAKNVTEAKNEANFIINNVLKGKQFEYPIYLDVEDKVQRALGKNVLTDIITTWCDTLTKVGYYVGIYSTYYFLRDYTHIDKLSKYEKWIAQWSTKCTSPIHYGMWQFGGETNYIRSNKVAGVLCDQDYCYLDYPKIIKAKGLNGFKKNLKSVSEIAKEVIDGKWGVGEDRKQKLTKAGYNYTAVQKKVNELLRVKTYTVKSGDKLTKIAKENNTTVDKIVADNKLIYKGLKLKL